MSRPIQPLLTAAEGYRLLRISRQQGWMLRRAGALRSVVIGNRIFFEREEIARFIASRRVHLTSESDSDRVDARSLVDRNADDPGDPSRH